MIKLWACLKKDIRIISRDKVGLTLLFIMPIILVVVITSVQNSAFEIVNDNKIELLLSNQDQGKLGSEFKNAIEHMGLFEMHEVSISENEFSDALFSNDAMVGILIPANFTRQEQALADNLVNKTLADLGFEDLPEQNQIVDTSTIILYFHPVLQKSFRFSINGVITSGLQGLKNKLMIETLYISLGHDSISEDIQNSLMGSQSGIKEVTLTKAGINFLPNASQHNVPAWTIFALFFMVISLGSNMVREKLEGSFVRIKTLPTSYIIGLLSKQITYLVVAVVQVFVIFSIGIWVFPSLDLPPLNMPHNLFGLVLVTVFTALSAISYSIFIGVFSNTQEQANGIGAVSVVILAAIGGIMVPDFVMPTFIQKVMVISPLHWCLEAYYELFLEGGTMDDIYISILPLLFFSIIVQSVAIVGMKRKNLI